MLRAFLDWLFNGFTCDGCKMYCQGTGKEITFVGEGPYPGRKFKICSDCFGVGWAP